MKRTKKTIITILKGLGFTLFTIIVLLLLLPVLFKEDILRIVKTELNKNLHAEVSFSDASFSFIRHFPSASLCLKELKITGKDSFQSEELFVSQEILLDFDILSVLNKKNTPELTRLDIKDPKLRMLILPSGEANYDIIQQSETTNQDTANGAVTVLLDKIKIINGYLLYQDDQSNLKYELQELNGMLSGTYRGTKLQSTLELTSPEATVVIGNISYINAYPAKVTGGLAYDLTSSRIDLTDMQIIINEFIASMGGYVAMNSNDINMDLEFSTPDQALKPFISLLPGAYTTNFSQVDASGDFNLTGTIQGNYNDQGEYPLYDIRTQIKNGRVKYPDLTESISNLTTQIRIKALDNRLNSQSIIIDTFHCNIAQSLIKGSLDMLYREVNSTYKGNIFADVNLQQIQKAWPMPGVEEIAGSLDVDLKFRFDQQQIDQKAYDKIKFNGNAQSDQLRISIKDYPAVNIDSAFLNCVPQSLKLIINRLSTAKSSLSAKIQVDDPLAYLSNERTPIANVSFNAGTLDLNEWMTETISEGSSDTSAYVITAPQVQAILLASVDELRYGEYRIKNLNTRLEYDDDRLSIQQLKGKWNESNLQINGELVSLFAWMSGNKPLQGNLQMNADYFDLNPWMAIDTANSKDIPDPNSQIKILPEDVEVNITASLDRLHYNDVDFDKMKGEATLVSQALEINSLYSESFGGNMAFSGLYSEVDPLRQFNLKLDLSQISFKEIFEQSKTFALIAPIAEYLQGKFNSTLVLDGKMSADGNLVWDQFNAAGFVETIAAELSDFQPLDQLAEKLNLQKLRSIPWQNTKNWFEVKGGSVFIKPFTITYQGIPMTISGQHRIDMQINYDLLLRVPRKLLDKTGIGKGVDTGINWVETQLKKVNVQQEIGDTVYIVTKLTGAFKNPVTSFQVVNRSGDKTLEEDVRDQISDIIQQKKDTLTKKVRDTLQKIQDSVTKVVQKEIDKKVQEAEKKGKQVVDTLKKQAVDKSKEVLDSVARQKIGKVIDSSLTGKVDTVLGKEVDKIKDALKNWDPFKKKKKDTAKVKGENR